ncbi:MAG: glycosyltransferase [Euryarchaeota archaeon]|nr:glycosyltransferase [Euryarchaeota archaeon]
MKLSIIIPTYNEEQYLPKLLKSIKSQDFTDHEVIVADAGSKDGTREIAESYGCNVVEGGLPAVGRNNGVKISRGEYLLFLDSDVVLTDGYLESALEEFKDNDLGIAITQIIPLSDRKIDKILHNFANFFMKSVESIKPHGAGCYGILTKKSLHNKIDGFDETLDFGEDSDYIERIGKLGSFKVLRKPRLLVSTRRLEKEGIKDLAFKYTKSTLYDFLGKKISAEDLNYNFGHSQDKKRILYAVCGEGMGHAIRSSVIIKYLLEKNEVIIFASGRAHKYLSERYNNVYSIYGFNTVYKENSVNNTQTFLKAMRNLPRDLKDNLELLYKVAEEFKPNIIISDFEFYSNLLSKLMRIPLISIDNMHIITQCRIEVPEKYSRDRLKAVGVIRSFIIRPRRYLITTFFYPEVKNKDKAALFPPILREEILSLKPKIGDYVLVYQTSDSNKRLINLLKSVDEKFVVYGYKTENVEENLCFRKFNENQFFKDLKSCKAVITNGGFTLIGESLYLKKPVLSIPVRGQFEQILNALYLKKLGYGEFEEELTTENLEKFLEKLNIYRESLKSYKYQGNQEILEELDRSIENYSKI